MHDKSCRVRTTHHLADPDSAALGPEGRCASGRREFVALEPPAAGVLRTPSGERFARVSCWRPQSAKLPVQAFFGACSAALPTILGMDSVLWTALRMVWQRLRCAEEFAPEEPKRKMMVEECRSNKRLVRAAAFRMSKPRIHVEAGRRP